MSTVTERSKTELEALESERLEQRSAVKRRLAECRLKDQQRIELESVIASLESKIDQADQEHMTATQPLRDELERLHQQQLASIIDGNESDPDADRRKELLAAIATHNVELERTYGFPTERRSRR